MGARFGRAFGLKQRRAHLVRLSSRKALQSRGNPPLAIRSGIGYIGIYPKWVLGGRGFEGSA